MATERPTAIQPSFEQLGTPLFDVTFVVVDLETTGLAPTTDRITEIGAVKVQRGEVLGEFHSLVHPGRTIPPSVTAVTGITDHLLSSAPPVAAVLPAFLEFVRDAVLVAHNAAFDHRFLDTELQRHGYPPLDLVVLDTARVARRVLRDEVRDVRLATLARHLRARTHPEHRALADARATVDVLHGLLERVGVLGATTLEDLQSYTRSSSDRAFRKVSLVASAPHAPGTYRFVDDRGEVLYVGKATDLRSRLRTYFGQDRRRRIADLVRLTDRVEWTQAATELEAAVHELRAIHRHRPRFNRRSKHPQRAVYVKLTDEAFPRLSIVTGVRDAAIPHLGPLPSRATAEAVVNAIHEALPIRRCSFRIRLAQDHPACVWKELGRCGAPCDGTQSRASYDETVRVLASAIGGPVAPILEPLRRRMRDLADHGRFERAGETRTGLHRLSAAIAAQRSTTALVGTAEIVARRPTRGDDEVVAIRSGRLVCSVTVPKDATDAEALRAVDSEPTFPDPPSGGNDAVPRELAEEIALIRGWLEQPDVRPLTVNGTYASTLAGGRALAHATAEARRVARQLRRDRQRLGGAKVVRRAG